MNNPPYALCLAAKRGVDVRIITPGIPETTFQKTVDFERSFLLCLIAGTGNLHGQN